MNRLVETSDSQQFTNFIANSHEPHDAQTEKVSRCVLATFTRNISNQLVFAMAMNSFRNCLDGNVSV